MNTCSTCRWWGENFTSNGQVVAECTRLEEKPSKAYASHDSALVTQPDFGCNQWEGKDATT